MRIKSAIPLVIGILVTLSHGPLRGQQPQVPMFRSGTELVDLYVTVTDDAGRLVPNLLREDFAIFDDQKPQEISLFDNDYLFSITDSIDIYFK